MLLCTPATGETWTATAAAGRRAGVAAGLLAAGPPAARIATCLGNGPEPVLLQLGVALAGMTLVPINPRSRPAELEHALRLSGAVCLYAAEDVGRQPGGRPGRAGGRAAAGAAGDPRVRRRLAGRDRALRRRPTLPVRGPGVASRRSSSPRAPRAGPRACGSRTPGWSPPAGPSPTGWARRRGGSGCNPMPLFHTAGNVLGVVGALWARAEHVVLPFAPEPVLRAHGRAPGDHAVGRADAAGPARAASRPAGARPVRTAGALHRRHDGHAGASSTGSSRCSARGCRSPSA